MAVSTKKPVSARREARELGLQLLFQLDINPRDVEETLKDFWELYPPSPKVRAFAEELVLGVMAHRGDLDATIGRFAENWDISRMGVIDRNVLRMALYEMHFRDDIPPVVTINEAVDVAKYFSNSDSGRFVNGVLDRARKELSRPPRSTAQAGESTRTP